MLWNIFWFVALICFFIGVAVAIKWIFIIIGRGYESAKTAISNYIVEFTDENYTKFRRDVDRMRHSENYLNNRVKELMVEVGRLKARNEELAKENEELKRGCRK